MRKIKRIAISILAACLVTGTTFAGNPDRAGQAGATQLLINPWARSSGWGGVNMAGMTGVEAMSFNVAGLVGINSRMEFNFSHANWMTGTGISINSFGMVQKIGESKSNALGVSIMSFNFGDIDMTTVGQPEGSGTFSIQMLNLGLGYSHKFSENINGGVLLRTLSEGVYNAKASGVALDAGIQYKAGTNDRIRFGVALRNIGPALHYSGDALATRGIIDGTDFQQTLNKRSSDFEMPSVLNIAASYDFYFDSTYASVLTVAGAFTSNAFSKDQFGLGLQYSYHKIIAIRAGYIYEPGMLNYDTRSTAFSGPSAGASVSVPFGKNRERSISIDYSYRSNTQFNGTHSIGARVNL